MRTFIMALAALVLTSAAWPADDAIPDRFSRAKAGEWVVMRDVSGRDSGTIKVSVAEVKGEGDDRVVVILVEREGEEPRRFEVTMARHKERVAEFLDKAKQISRERLTVKGQEMMVTAVSWDDEEEGREFKIWLSDEIPVNGIAKSWSSDPDVPSAEIVDYGF